MIFEDKALLAYQQEIEKELVQEISKKGEQTKLLDACIYAIKSKGKRIRPLIVLAIGEAIGDNRVMPAALAVEFFHTASLITDDLPCMDNEKRRRNKPTLHRVFGQSTALLVSYTFIAAAYGMICKNAECLKERGYLDSDERCSIATQTTSYNGGICGATSGQFLDLFPPDNSIETIFKIIDQKTTALFEISFVLGWLFGGGDLNKLVEIKKCSYHFGKAFQIADDLNDMKQDHKEINIAIFLGPKAAFELFEGEIRELQSKLKRLNLLTPTFKKIISYLVKTTQKAIL